jgi:hypothetical protein
MAQSSERKAQGFLIFPAPPVPTFYPAVASSEGGSAMSLVPGFNAT